MVIQGRDPTIRKEVKVSVVFRFTDSADKVVGTVDGLMTVPAVRFATAGGGGEPMVLGELSKDKPTSSASTSTGGIEAMSVDDAK